MRKIERIIVHHSGSDSDTYESVRRYHLSRGWVDIGYDFWIGREGELKAGRSLYIPGAHCIGQNSLSVSICVAGNYEIETVPEKLFDALLTISVSIVNVFGKKGIYGHRDFSNTLCPGKYLYCLLPDLRNRVDYYYLKSVLDGRESKRKCWIRRLLC